MKFLLPSIVLLSELLGRNKDVIRGFYVSINNIIVQSTVERYPSGEILMLLPHCLQDSECGCKVTRGIDKCKKCGKCCIGTIADIAEDFKVEVAVVTGGTVARNIVEKSKPGLILSVACERDLASGIADVGSIPVIGVLNERPNGPCNNTVVNVEALRDKLESVIKKYGD